MNYKEKTGKIYDLMERTSRFGEDIIYFTKKIHHSNFNSSIIQQLIRSSTSVGANYAEAIAASSRKDFQNKIYYCRKEANETKHWLRMLIAANQEIKLLCLPLWQEAHELTLIFAKATLTLKKGPSPLKT